MPIGTIVRGTAVPRHECPGGHFAGGDNHAYDTGRYNFGCEKCTGLAKSVYRDMRKDR